MAIDTQTVERDVPRSPAEPMTIGHYLIDRLQALGVEHVFGIPGDYILGLYKMLEDSPIERRRHDPRGRRRLRGRRLRPGPRPRLRWRDLLRRRPERLQQHRRGLRREVAGGRPDRLAGPRRSGSGTRCCTTRSRSSTRSIEVFKQFTAAATVLDDPLTAFAEIDRVLEAAVRYKRPVYIEVPRDLVTARQVHPHADGRRPCRRATPTPSARRSTRPRRCSAGAERPMILADVEIHRFGLQDELLALAEATGLPIATTILGKSVISEEHPLFAGVYEGAMGRDEVTEFVEESDCLLMLGCFLTDINLGIFTAKLDPSRCIDATSEDLRIRHHHYRDVRLDDFLRGLRGRGLKRERPEPAGAADAGRALDRRRPGAPLTSARLFARLNHLVDEQMMVIADIGDSLFGSADLRISRRTEFLSPAYYTSMGFAVPAAVGAGMANRGPPAPGDRRRRRLPDDRHGAVDGRPQRPEPDRRRAEQQGVHHRAVPARRPVQRHPQLGVPQDPRGPRRRARPGGPHRGRAGRGARAGPGQHRELQPAERPPRPARPEPGPGAAGGPKLAPSI